MRRRVRARSAIVALLGWTLVAAGLGGVGPAAAAEPDGRRLMEMLEDAERTDGGYAEGLVSVEDKGRMREKAWRQWRLGWGGEARSLVQFLEPAEVRGVGLLTLGQRQRADEQWFYAPAIDRHRRIARVEKSTRFLGTHFTYEDMEPRDIDDHDYRRLDDSELDGVACYRIEARPRPRTESQYSRLIHWLAREPLVILRSEGWIDGKPRRVFQASRVAAVDGIPTAHRWVVEDSKRGGRTVLVLRNVRHGLDVEPRLFSREAMRVLHDPPSPPR